MGEAISPIGRAEGDAEGDVQGIQQSEILRRKQVGKVNDRPAMVKRRSATSSGAFFA